MVKRNIKNFKKNSEDFNGISKYQQKLLAREESSYESKTHITHLIQAIEDNRPKLSLIDKLFEENSNSNINILNLGGLVGEFFVNSWINSFSDEVILPTNQVLTYKNGYDKSSGVIFYNDDILMNNQELETDNIYSFEGFNGFVEVKTSVKTKSRCYSKLNGRLHIYLDKQDELFQNNSGLFLLFSGRCRTTRENLDMQKLEIALRNESSLIKSNLEKLPQFSKINEYQRERNLQMNPEVRK